MIFWLWCVLDTRTGSCWYWHSNCSGKQVMEVKKVNLKWYWMRIIWKGSVGMEGTIWRSNSRIDEETWSISWLGMTILYTWWESFICCLRSFHYFIWERRYIQRKQACQLVSTTLNCFIKYWGWLCWHLRPNLDECERTWEIKVSVWIST